MNVDTVPIVGEILAAGPNDRVFDSLLLAGPLLVVAIALLGRSMFTSLSVVGYLVAFVGYTLTKSLSS
ncbi:hypothetical protein M0R88_17950 [Halorussus gelatinilyticus]|uniref:Uncharacterized protein n=1 Tax=Halorussus gelatinilyticus TaxID=2937524 RepID=A0A8U0II44_9EURY|nr:hypothetical protein [Halorussus gelatinilyticus]UPW00375.1 hypothetical protein M0R88_17950 [Halorussus gelatinilyticus]